MRVNDRMMHLIVYVGHAGTGPFVAYGTGFLMVKQLNDFMFQHIVTAKHVIDAIPGNTVHIRVNNHEGKARVIETTRAHWLSHPNPAIDVAVCASRIPQDQYAIGHFDIEDRAFVYRPQPGNQHVFCIGDPVQVMGMFVKRMGEAANLPILRTGTIAAMPVEKIHTTYGFHHAYLIEVRSIDGLSGSPVIAIPEPTQVFDGKWGLADKPNPKLIGMLLGHDNTYNPHDRVEIASPGNDKSGSEVIVPMNTGIGIVLPVEYVAEAIDQPALQKLREDGAMRAKKDSSFIPDSAVRMKPGTASKSALPTTAENPQHKEDFTQLLGAAVKKPQQDG